MCWDKHFPRLERYSVKFGFSELKLLNRLYFFRHRILIIFFFVIRPQWISVPTRVTSSRSLRLARNGTDKIFITLPAGYCKEKKRSEVMRYSREEEIKMSIGTEKKSSKHELSHASEEFARADRNAAGSIKFFLDNT